VIRQAEAYEKGHLVICTITHIQRVSRLRFVFTKCRRAEPKLPKQRTANGEFNSGKVFGWCLLQSSHYQV
jgi:hypothetical protein